MIEPLRDVRLRVFRSLVQEQDRDTVDAIAVELSRASVPHHEIEAALKSLADSGYVETFGDGHWRATAQGLAIRESLLGTRYHEGAPVAVEVEGHTIRAEFVRPGNGTD